MISVIIPTLNEEKNIEKLLIKLNNINYPKEILIVDGGSNDKTALIASKYGKVLTSPRGRCNQLNFGAKNAKGDILWFLHCDSIIDDYSFNHIERTIKENFIGGCFSLYFYDFKTIFLKYISYTSNLRAKYLKLIFGDQGLFIRKDVFFKLEGFKKMPIMEDWEFSTRLKREGKTKVLKTPIGTSARRFINGGQFKTHILMHKIKILYLLGTPPDKLSKIYKDIR
ncbi:MULTISPECIES: TIGR04283 family arsenosugar biosynthesis glycosyltransferase [Clostridium]|uniref:4,4'-diaponeurosporenoate glycosyltransferase n=1 Tax=Clostridium senegalense TaxID=1465809 RepID=A0A6M0H9H6_9CLOT|nr:MULTISPECIES: TIGR04283 family arsenosugar biosynthesis glycosyltransferase [Clostridium]NEU06292.1 glycosyltransferase family 2 protein [Clostridium senegalense]